MWTVAGTTNVNLAIIDAASRVVGGPNFFEIKVPGLGGGTAGASILIDGNDTSGGGGNLVSAIAGSKIVDLIEDNGASSFLQLASVQQLAIDYGTANLTYSGSTTASATVPHNLGRTPKAIFTTLAGSVGQSYSLSADTLTSSNFTLHGFTTPALTITLGHYWIAIG